MYGNPFDLDYTRFSLLATAGTWFKNLWELLTDFEVLATLDDECHLHWVCLGNLLLMFEFSKHFSSPDLSALNVVCQHKKVIHLSCIILCNGHTINKDCLTPGAGFSDYHKFSLQCPSRADHLLWTTAIKKISSDFFVLPSSLGKFISWPHQGFRWTTDVNGSILHLEMMSDSTTKYLTYYPTHATHTRSGQRFIQGNTFCKSPLPYYASVTWFLDTSVFLHSWLEQFVPETTLTLFWENIRSIDNPSMWKNLRCNGDGTWIYNGLRMGLLIVIHNGSYMKEESISISAAAVMNLCIVTGSIYKCTIAEHSASASSYRCEILGAIITQIIL